MVADTAIFPHICYSSYSPFFQTIKWVCLCSKDMPPSTHYYSEYFYTVEKEREGSATKEREKKMIETIQEDLFLSC